MFGKLAEGCDASQWVLALHLEAVLNQRQTEIRSMFCFNRISVQYPRKQTYRPRACYNGFVAFLAISGKVTAVPHSYTRLSCTLLL